MTRPGQFIQERQLALSLEMEMSALGMETLFALMAMALFLEMIAQAFVWGLTVAMMQALGLLRQMAQCQKCRMRPRFSSLLKTWLRCPFPQDRGFT